MAIGKTPDAVYSVYPISVHCKLGDAKWIRNLDFGRR